MTQLPFRIAGFALLCCGAWAQRVQNIDISILVGPVAYESSFPPDPSIKIHESRGFVLSTGYGYQVARLGGVSVWAEFAPAFVLHGVGQTSAGGTVLNDFITIPARARLMLPI